MVYISICYRPVCSAFTRNCVYIPKFGLEIRIFVTFASPFVKFLKFAPLFQTVCVRNSFSCTLCIYQQYESRIGISYFLVLTSYFLVLTSQFLLLTSESLHFIGKSGQTDRQTTTDRQADRQTDRHTDKQAGRQARSHTQTDRQRDRQERTHARIYRTDRHTSMLAQTDRDMHARPHTSACVRTYKHACVRTYIHACVRTCMSVCVSERACLPASCLSVCLLLSVCLSVCLSRLPYTM